MSDRKSYKTEDFDTRVDRVPAGFEVVATPQGGIKKYDVICADCRESALGVYKQ